MAFLAYPYVRAAEEVFQNVRVCRIEDDGEPLLFFPFQYRSPIHRFFGIAECAAGNLSDYFGIIAKKGAKIDSRALLSKSKLTAILFTHLQEFQLDFGLKGQSPEIGHLAEFPNGGHSFWQEKRLTDKRFVLDTERLERRLEKELGPVRFELQTLHPEAELEKLITAKRLQYVRTKVTDPLSSTSSVQFLHLLLKTAHPLCSGVMSTAYVGDTWVASHFGLQCDKTIHYWFPVYNLNLRAYSPGRLLLKRIIMHGHERGISRADFGAGDSPSKRDFSTGTHDYYRGLWSAGTPFSLPYRAGLSALWRYNKIRARLNGVEAVHVSGRD